MEIQEILSNCSSQQGTFLEIAPTLAYVSSVAYTQTWLNAKFHAYQKKSLKLTSPHCGHWVGPPSNCPVERLLSAS